MLAQFLKFAVVGVIGFVVDAGVLYGVVALFGLDLYSGRVVSFLAAATTTWSLNRRFTFRDATLQGRTRQWGKFIAVNAIGGLVNYAVYAAMIANGGLAVIYPVLAVAAGSLAGLGFNFSMSRLLVFRSTNAAVQKNF